MRKSERRPVDERLGRKSRTPVRRRERNSPEERSGIDELDAPFGFAVVGRAKVDDVAFKLFAGTEVNDAKFLTGGDFGTERDQSAVSVDDEGDGLLGERRALGVSPMTIIGTRKSTRWLRRRSLTLRG